MYKNKHIYKLGGSMKIIVDNNIRMSELNEIEYKFLNIFCKEELSIDGE